MTDPRDAMLLLKAEDVQDAAEALSLMYANSYGTSNDEISARLRARSALSLLRAALAAREEPVDDSIIERLSDEADLCRQEGATDVANLLDEARTYISRQVVELFRLAISPVAAPVEARPVAWLCCGSLFHSYSAIPSAMLPPLGHPVPLYASPVAADTQGDALAVQEHAAEIASAFADLPDALRAHPGVKRLYRVAVRSLASGAAMKEQPSDGAEGCVGSIDRSAERVENDGLDRHVAAGVEGDGDAQ